VTLVLFLACFIKVSLFARASSHDGTADRDDVWTEVQRRDVSDVRQCGLQNYLCLFGDRTALLGGRVREGKCRQRETKWSIISDTALTQKSREWYHLPLATASH